MKKIILLGTLLFLFPLKVSGLIDLGYIERNNNYIIDENDFKFIYGEWMPYNEKDIENIEIRREYIYSTINPLRCIEISNTDLKIREIEIYHNDEKLKYSISCTQCGGQNTNYLNDGIINDTKTYTNEKRGKLVLRLKKEYPLNELKIKINVTNINNSFDLIFSNDYYKYDNTITKNIKLNNNEETIEIDDSWEFNVEYSNPITTNEYIENTWYRKVENKSEYRTVTKLFRHYEKELINNNVIQESIPIPTISKTSYQLLENTVTSKIKFNNSKVVSKKNNNENKSNEIINQLNNIDNEMDHKDIIKSIPKIKDINEQNIMENISTNKLILFLIILSIISILLIYINKNYRKC